MILENDLPTRKVMEMILLKDGFEVICSTAISLDNDLAHHNPHVIVADYWLDELGLGAEICIRLKKSVATAKIPFILTSATADLPGIANRCGADAYVEKPFDLVDLCNTIKDILSL